MQGLAERGTMVGLDCCDVEPYLVPTELTADIAVQLPIETFAA